MAKRPSSFLNMTLTLLVVTLVASVALGFVYEITKEPIAQAQLAKRVAAIQAVLPPYDNDPLAESFKKAVPGSADSLEFFPGKKAGELVGMAVKTFSKKGYSGYIWLMVGFGPDGRILKTTVLDHKETPGLGSKMSDAGFASQFVDKSPATFSLKVRKDGGEVDAISGATISSRAFAEAIQLAYDHIQK